MALIIKSKVAITDPWPEKSTRWDQAIRIIAEDVDGEWYAYLDDNGTIHKAVLKTPSNEYTNILDAQRAFSEEKELATNTIKNDGILAAKTVISENKDANMVAIAKLVLLLTGESIEE